MTRHQELYSILEGVIRELVEDYEFKEQEIALVMERIYYEIVDDLQER
jgi:hypothetical protein